MTTIQKKAMTFTTLLIMIIALAVFVLMVIIFFVGPQALFMKVKAILPRADTFIKRGTGETADYLYREQRELADNLFSEFTNKISLLQKGMWEEKLDADGNPTKEQITNACFYFIEPPAHYKPLFKPFKVSFQEMDYGIRVRLDPNLKSAESQTGSEAIVGISSIKLEGLKPCLVRDQAASTFYNNWLDVEASPVADPANPPKDYLKQDHFVLNYEEITDEQQNDLRWETKNGPIALYIHDDHICFFPTRIGMVTRIGMGKCEYTRKKGLLESLCFKSDEEGLVAQATKKGAYIYSEQEEKCVASS